MTPDDFWTSTFDEVLLVIKGKVDDWRFQRTCAWKIVEGFRGSADMPKEVDFVGLPYDEEIRMVLKKEQDEALAQYLANSEYLKNFDWAALNKN